MINAEAGIVDQVGAEIVAKPLGQRGDHQRKGYHHPGIMHMQKMRNQASEVKVPLAIGKAKGNGTFGRIGTQDLVKDGLQQKNAKGFEQAHRGKKQDTGQPLNT